MSISFLAKLGSVLGVLCFALSLRASPPVDLSDYDGAQRVVRRNVKPLTDKDLIFTDNIIKPEKLLHGLVLFKVETIGRAQADAQSKALLRFRPDYRARFLRYSQNRQWIAVELLNGKKRAWVPAASVEVLDEKQNSQDEEYSGDEE